MNLQTAPMGWNSWDCYGAAVTEDIVRDNAAFMAEHLKQYGWEYITVDIQWAEPTAQNHEYHPFTELCMDEYSRLIPAVNRFPSSADGKGFAPLAEYVHSLGLKFGIHIMAWNSTSGRSSEHADQRKQTDRQTDCQDRQHLSLEYRYVRCQPGCRWCQSILRQPV